MQTQETYNGKISLSTQEKLNEYAKDSWNPAEEVPKRAATDLLEFRSLLSELNNAMIIILLWLSTRYYWDSKEGKLRVGASHKTLGMFAQVGENLAREYVNEMLVGKLTCKICGRQDKILEIDEPYTKGKEGNSYKLFFIEHLKHIRRDHFNQIGEVAFNKIVGDYTQLFKKKPTAKQMSNLKGFKEW